MEWMNISYILAFLAVFVASASQILLKQSAETEHKNIITKFLNWRVILGYGLLGRMLYRAGFVCQSATG